MLNRIYSYRLIDLTVANHEHWKRKEQALLELKADFAAEGNMFLYNNRMEEFLGGLGQFGRYLFVIEENRCM